MFRRIFKTATWRQSQITVVGSVINGGLGALFYILLARILGPSDFGILTVSVATLVLIADVADLGTNTGLVRYVSASLNSNRDKALKFLKLSLEIKLFLWFIVMITGISLAGVVASGIFNKPELTNPLRLVMIGVGGVLLFSFATSSLQAFQKYVLWSGINVVTNFLRVTVIVILFFFNSLNLQTGLFSYIIFPFVGFSLALLFLPFKKVLYSKNEFSVAKEFFKYNIWVAFFIIIAAISGRLDTFLTARLLSAKELGIYGAATQLTIVVPQIITALGAVAAPKFSSFVNAKDMLAYLKKFQLLVTGLCLLGVVSIPILVYLIPFIFGQDYSAMVGPFIILFTAMLVFLFSIPVHTAVIYYFSSPNVFVWVSIGHLLIIGLGGYFLIIYFGIFGAAWIVLAGTIFNFLVPLAWFLLRLRRKG